VIARLRYDILSCIQCSHCTHPRSTHGSFALHLRNRSSSIHTRRVVRYLVGTCSPSVYAVLLHYYFRPSVVQLEKVQLGRGVHRSALPPSPISHNGLKPGTGLDVADRDDIRNSTHSWSLKHYYHEAQQHGSRSNKCRIYRHYNCRLHTTSVQRDTKHSGSVG